MLIWFGGKRNQRRKLLPLFPKTETIVSPFLGGAKVEIELAKQGIEVIANDLDSGLINVFRQFQERKDELLQLLCEVYINVSREHLEELRDEYREFGFDTGLESAAKYLTLNFSSYNGIMNPNTIQLKTKRTYLTTKCSVVELTYFNINRLRRLERLEYRPFKLYNEDWETFINRQDQSLFSYLDPPYFGIKGKPYQHTFTEDDHLRLRDYLADRGNFLLSYNNHNTIMKLYGGDCFRIHQLDYFVNSIPSGKSKKKVADLTIFSNRV